MRILVATTAGLGHILPVLPLARELLARGHQMRWIVPPGSAEVIEAAGFDVVLAGTLVAERQAEFFRRYPDASTLPLPERRVLFFSKLFGELAAPPMAEALRPVAEQWAPDLLLHDAAELAGPLIAAARDIPSVCHGFGDVVPELGVRRAGDEVAALWRAAGLEPDPYAGSYRGLYIDIYPPSLRTLDTAHIPLVQRSRPADGPRASGDLVYVTFGTVFNAVDDTFRDAVLAAAAAAPEVLVTMGRQGDLSGLGELPANVAVEHFVTQADVLPRCATVICHGGSGTLLAALAHGIPLLCLPRAADQFANALNVSRVGAGRALIGPDATASAMAEALEHLLTAPEPRAAAAACAEEIALMPGLGEVADAVEAHAS